jgi:hypothetical protein
MIVEWSDTIDGDAGANAFTRERRELLQVGFPL